MARKSPGVARFLSAMRKHMQEVNDHEICRRLEIIMQSEKEDFAPHLVKRLLDAPLDFDPDEVKDPYIQYVRHYIYMVKRSVRDKEKRSIANEATAANRGGAQKVSKKKGPTRKKQVRVSSTAK